MAADTQNPGARRPAPDQPDGADPAGDQARLQELSRKLLDLWQDHLSAIAQDPNLLAQALKLMTAAPFAWMPGFPPQGGAGFAQPANPFTPWSFGGPFGAPGPGAAAPATAAPTATPGAAAPAAAPAAGADDLGQLRRRLAELEGRLAEFEGARPKSAGSGAGGPGRARKSGPGAGKPRRGAAKR